ncbi:MAG TPA: PilZ domain-containing protein [Candidatus Xenobia bacterium]|jgi:hypothetical protein
MSDTNILEHVLEMRQDVRVPCALPVQVAVPAEETPVVGQLVDVSPRGLCMRLNRVLRPGQAYPLYVAPGAGWDGMIVNARPVWVKATPDGYGFDIGCELTDGARLPAFSPAPAHQQRRALRVSGAIQTQLRWQGRCIEAVTRDLSFSGAGIATAWELPVGTVLRAWFKVNANSVVKADVEVVHCEPLLKGGYLLGVTFRPMEAGQARRLATVIRFLKLTRGVWPKAPAA